MFANLTAEVLMRRPTRPQILKLLTDYALLTVGAIALIYAYRTFMLPFGIAGGGVSGFGLVVNEWTGFPPGMAMLIANLPVLVLGYLRLGGMRFLTRTAFVIAIYNIGVDALPDIFPDRISDDLLLIALFGGVVSGLGGGLIYRAGGTGAGAGVISRVVQLRTGLPVSQIYLMIDGSILILQGLTFGWEKALYGVILLFVNGLAVDYVLEGPSVVRTVTVVTEQPDMLADTVFATMNVGVTGWKATGMYTDRERGILFCTVSRSEANRLVEAIRAADPSSFAVIGNAHQRRGGLIRSGAPMPEPELTSSEAPVI
ncbi:MAG: YitT family protein [Acidimicrobiia bacterium]|nr:YitT family protein [Acidimicrobiia bacterium]